MAINWQYRISLQSSRTLYMGILIFLMILPSFNTSAASEKVSLQLAWKHQFQFAGYYAALHKGYYRQAGLEVKIIEGGKGKFAREEVLKDRSQYGVAGSELILHRKDGDPFVVLAPIFQHSASILLSRKDSGISNLQDMITKRVMMLPENKDADILVAFLNEGIALDQIRRLDQTYNLNDLIEGRTDVVSAYSTNEPWSLLQKNIEPVIISPQTYGVDFYSDCLFTTQSEVEDHQQRVKAFLEASILGWEYAMDHPEEIIDLLLTDYGVKKNRDHLLYEAEEIRKIMMPDLVEIGHMNPGRWSHIKTTYEKLGLIDADFSLEGFLYDPRSDFDYIWLKKVIVATISIIAFLGIGALALLFFNRKLASEIDERKRVEVKLRNSERLLTEAQRVAKIGHWEFDSPSGTPMWSEEIFHIFGLDPEKSEPSFMAHKDIIYNADWDLLNSSIKELSLKGIHFDIEFRILRSNGQIGWMHGIGSADKSEDGGVHRMFGTAQDVTERKQLESQLQKARKMESIGNLAGGIAHDFNNLLYMIVGNTELALEDIPKWSPAYTNLEEIKSASLRASGIVKQLLNFSRKTDQKLIPIDAVTVIKDSLKFLRSTIPSTVKIHEQFPDNDIIILADSTQINQIMMNLCINASQAMEETGGTLKINIEKTICDAEDVKEFSDLVPGNYLKITVSDTGSGISSEIIDRIYDPYFTTKKMGKGSGMGLSIVHGIIKNHGGAIWVDRCLGKGATFTLLFPMAEKKTVIKTEIEDEYPSGTETILFVDDEKSITDMVQQVLEKLGYRVEARLNPVEALDLFQSKPNAFDLVITDMTMPQMTGAKLVQKLKEIQPDVPVIICTGHSSLIDEEKAKRLGIAGYVMKPASMSTIAKVIRNVLDK